MDIRTEARTAGRHPRAGLGAVTVTAVLVLGLTACGTGTDEGQGLTPAGLQQRPPAVAPAGIDPHRPADRLVEAIERREAELAERFRGVPADRIDDALRRDAAGAAAHKRRAVLAACAVRLVQGGYARDAASAHRACGRAAPAPTAD